MWGSIPLIERMRGIRENLQLYLIFGGWFNRTVLLFLEKYWAKYLTEFRNSTLKESKELFFTSSNFPRLSTKIFLVYAYTETRKELLAAEKVVKNSTQMLWNALYRGFSLEQGFYVLKILKSKLWVSNLVQFLIIIKGKISASVS